MPAFPAGEARRLRSLGSPRAGPAPAALLFAALLSGCAARTPHGAAAAADRARGTGVFSWLVEHEPSSVVAWKVAPQMLRELLPGSVVRAAASERPCPQAARAHAALVLVEAPGGAPQRAARREYALNCGVSLYRDAAAVVVAPLP